MRSSSRSAIVGLLALALLPSSGLGQNNPPDQPVVTEPAQQGQLVNPSDVHMETAPFSDPDPGDEHLCTDWELWTLTPLERIWFIDCIQGVERVHTHLGDGTFENSHAGRTELLPNLNFRLRVRHSDDSGDPATRWSPWGEREFRSGDLLTVFPLELKDVIDPPVPRWVRASDGDAVILPGGAPAGFLRVESIHGDLLLGFEGLDGSQNIVTNPGALSHHDPVKVHVKAGSSSISLPISNLTLFSDDCSQHVLLLPLVELAPGQEAWWWIASTGTSYAGNATQTAPNFGELLRGLSPPWHARQPGYQVEVFASGFQLPVNIAFVPLPGPNPQDPLFYVTELYGKIKVVLRDGTVGDYATGLLNFDPSGAFPGSGEQGLAGIVVDPASGDVFASMLYDSATTPGTHYPKVTRFTSVDGGHSAATETTILDMPGEPQGQSHQISRLSIGPDGKLYVHMGDGFNASTGQNLNSFRGKILRTELDGSPATDNPLYDPTNGISATDYIYAYGLRNPFGGGWRESDGMYYMVENGPSIDRFAQIVAGRNYLWDGSNASMNNFALHAWQPSTAPVNIVFMQPGQFGGSGFPSAKMDRAFISESGPTYAGGPQQNGKRITEWVLDGAGNLLTGPISFLEYAGAGRATVCGLAAGPDGMYMTELYRDDGTQPTQAGARILRISYDASFDCNQNGIADACDIATGVSLDRDGNGVPDECDCVGLNFCQATPNSTGVQAGISSNGACTVADNALELAASPVPNQPGIFFYSQNQVNGGAGLPFMNGFRCAGGGAIVYRLPAVLGVNHVARLTVDLTSPPTLSGQITAGSTWHFQYWFRDPAAGGFGANLSDGLSITFR